MPATGVPARELFLDGGALCNGPLRGPGGADIGRVDIWSGGRDLPFACGCISSKFTGSPRAIKCCCRMRERVQFMSSMRGGESISMAYKQRLHNLELQHSKGAFHEDDEPFRRD